MSRSHDDAPPIVESFPRVSGDEPLRKLGLPGKFRFSPRERG